MVSVDGDGPIFSQDSVDLLVELRDVEPVDGLTGGHQVHGVVLERQQFG